MLATRFHRCAAIIPEATIAAWVDVSTAARTVVFKLHHSWSSHQDKRIVISYFTSQDRCKQPLQISWRIKGSPSTMEVAQFDQHLKRKTRDKSSNYNVNVRAHGVSAALPCAVQKSIVVLSFMFFLQFHTQKMARVFTLRRPFVPKGIKHNHEF